MILAHSRGLPLTHSTTKLLSKYAFKILTDYLRLRKLHVRPINLVLEPNLAPVFRTLRC
jgi:hypothetical protein